MWTTDCLFDLEGSNRVAQNVTHVGIVPIEAFDFCHPNLVYTDTVYTAHRLKAVTAK
jgi:hypothetical protein